MLDGKPAPPPSPPKVLNLTDCANALKTTTMPAAESHRYEVEATTMSEAATVLALAADLDRILLTDKHFLMADWIQAARKDAKYGGP